MFEDIQQAVTSVVTKIFETMFFIFIEPLEEGENLVPRGGDGQESIPSAMDEPSPIFISTEISFQGKSSGKMTLFLPQDLATKMAINFMGLKQTEIPESLALDVAGELTNMISGNLLSLLDRKAGYRISIPTAHMVSGEEMVNCLGGSGLTMTFMADGQRFTLRIDFDSWANWQN